MRSITRTDPSVFDELASPKHSYLPLATLASARQVVLMPEIFLKIGSYLTDARDIVRFFWGVGGKTLFNDKIQYSAFETLKNHFPQALTPPLLTNKDWCLELAYQTDQKTKKEQTDSQEVQRIKFAIDKGYPSEKIIQMINDANLKKQKEILDLFSTACFAVNIDIIEYFYKAYPKLLAIDYLNYSFYIDDFIKQSNTKLDFNILKSLDSSDVPILTPIHFALINGDVKKIEALLLKLELKNKNILTTFKNRTGTFLHFAALTGNVEMINFLVKRGLSVFEKDGYKRTPFEYAAGLGHLDAVRYLYEATRPSKDFLTHTLRYVVKRCDKCRGDNTAVIQFLLDKGADPLAVLKKTDFSQQKAIIHHAAYRGSGKASEYKENQKNLVCARMRLIKKSHVLQKLNSIFIAADVKKEKNKIAGNQENIYQQAAHLFESLTEEGFLDWRGEKAFAKTIAAHLREKGKSIEFSQDNIQNCYDFIKETTTAYKNNGGTIKDFGTLDTLLYYLQNKANKIEKPNSNQESLENDSDFESNKSNIINMIDAYLNERKFNDSFTQFKMYFFGKDSNQNCAITYKNLFEKAQSSKEFYLILNALFESKSETLKSYIRKDSSFSSFKPNKINPATKQLSKAIGQGYSRKSYKIKNILTQ